MKQNNQTLVSKLGLPTAAPVAKQPSTRIVRFQAWKAAREQGNTAAGYDSSSPIYGKTDLEVLAMLEAELTAPGIAQTNENIANARALIEALTRRKVGRQLAGQTYRASK